MGVLLCAAVGAAGFRLRGSALWSRITGRGAGTARVFAWALPLAVVSPLPWAWVPALAAALWLGSLAAWWGSLDMGRNEGSFARDFALHALRGMVWVIPAALVLTAAGRLWWPLLAAGALCAPIYAVAWRIWPVRATEAAECGFGACIGAAIGAA